MAGASDWMVTNMVTATPFETVAEVARRMSSANVGAVLVVKDGELWGLFSERDMVSRIAAQKRDPNTTDVGEVATRELVTVDADSTAADGPARPSERTSSAIFPSSKTASRSGSCRPGISSASWWTAVSGVSMT